MNTTTTKATTTIKTTTASTKKPKATTEEVNYEELCEESMTIGGEFKEDPNICNKYIRCNHGYAQKFACAKDTAWDVEKKMCLWRRMVKCEDRMYVTDEELLGLDDSEEVAPKKERKRTTNPITTIIATRRSKKFIFIPKTKKKKIHNCFFQFFFYFSILNFLFIFTNKLKREWC